MAPQTMTTERRYWWRKLFIGMARRLRGRGQEFRPLADYFRQVAMEYR